ncbi:MAG: toast rack family protein [Candidatus Aminicenantes bacterium]|nr:toast rack family protein [Candidatus Aminicenantes bacterium]
MHRGQLARILIVAGLLAAFVACEEDVPLQTESKVVPAGEAKSADVTLKMGAGRLRLEGGAAELLEGTFRFRRERYRPEIDYRVFAERGELVVRHRRHLGFFNSGRNTWEVRLQDGLPISLRVDLGAGESDLDLRRVNLERLDVDMGVGEMTLDLRGPRTRDCEVTIDGGVGSGRIYFPTEVGVRVHVDGGLGSIHAAGLVKKGEYYVNDAYGRAPVTLEVRVDVGIGSLELRATGGKTGFSI